MHCTAWHVTYRGGRHSDPAVRGRPPVEHTPCQAALTSLSTAVRAGRFLPLATRIGPTGRARAIDDGRGHGPAAALLPPCAGNGHCHCRLVIRRGLRRRAGGRFVQGVVHLGRRRLRQGAALHHLRATAGDGTRRVRADHAHRPQDARTLLLLLCCRLVDRFLHCRVCISSMSMHRACRARVSPSTGTRG